MARRRSQRETKHGDIEHASAELDVRLLDTVAQIEALLRDSREIQREALRVRGIPVANTKGQRRASAAKIVKLVGTMGKNQRSIGSVLDTLRACARDLERKVRSKS
jgi:hypothetical protein